MPDAGGFLGILLRGEARAEEVDDHVAARHAGEAVTSLAEHLGMTEAGCPRWVTDARAPPDTRAARRAGAERAARR